MRRSLLPIYIPDGGMIALGNRFVNTIIHIGVLGWLRARGRPAHVILAEARAMAVRTAHSALEQPLQSMQDLAPRSRIAPGPRITDLPAYPSGHKS